MSGAVPSPHVVVVGGGVTGLSAAYYLRKLRPGLRVTLLEGSARLGGCIATEEREGFLIDAGPDSFLRTKPDGVALCKELALDGEFISTRPEARNVFIAHHGALEPMPGGMVLAVPTQLGPMMKTPLLSLPGKLRALGDIVLGLEGPQRRHATDDESIGQFLTRHFGAEATRRIAGPLLGGLYAGDIADLSIVSTFPQLVELEARHGSVILGLFAAERERYLARNGAAAQGSGLVELVRWLRREAEQAPSPFVSLRGGMGRLIDKLRGQLPADAISLGEAATRLTRREGARRWIVDTSRGRHEADAVLLAVPANVAARIVPEGRVARLLAAIPYLSTAAVFFALDRSAVEHPLAGSGFIVPAGEGEDPGSHLDLE